MFQHRGIGCDFSYSFGCILRRDHSECGEVLLTMSINQAIKYLQTCTGDGQ